MPSPARGRPEGNSPPRLATPTSAVPRLPPGDPRPAELPIRRRRRRSKRLDQQIAFIELRQEHRAERGEGQRRHHKARDTRPDRHGRTLHGPVQPGFVALLQPRDDAAVLLLDLLRSEAHTYEL